MNNLLKKIALLIVLVGVYPNIYLINFLPKLPKTCFRLICICVVFILYLFQIIKYKRIDIMLILCSLFSVYQTMITFICREDMISVIYSNVFIALSCLIMTKLFVNYDKQLYIDVSFWYFFVMTFINAISTFVAAKENITTSLFYGNRNDIYKFFIPLIFFTLLKYRDSRKYYLYIVMLITLIPAIYCGSLSTSILLIILYLYILFFINKEIKLLNINIYLIVSLIGFVVFVLPGSKNVVLSNIIQFLGKDSTASGRLIIYDETLKLIKNGNIIFGNGFIYAEKCIKLLSGGNGHFHSTYLELMYRYGVIGIVFSTVIYYIYVKIIRKSNNIYLKNLCQIIIFCMMFWSIANTLFYHQCLYFLGLCTYFIGSYEYSFTNKRIEFYE